MTLDGELLEKSGAMTGGSLSQRSSGLSFGRSSDQDEAEPLRRRLLELGESLVACRREESKLAQLIEQQKPQLRELEKQQAALIAERNAARRNHGPLLERSRQRAERLSKLQQDQTEQQQRLEAISPLHSPHSPRNCRPWMRRSATAATTTMPPPGPNFRRNRKPPTNGWRPPAASATSC